MNNKNSGRKFVNCYEDECGNMKDKNYDFNINLDFDLDLNETDECVTSELENLHNDDCEEVYQDGYKEGYGKALQEILHYMKKNKCCIKCKRRDNSKNKRCAKCRHNCKLRKINMNKCFIKCKHN